MIPPGPVFLDPRAYRGTIDGVAEGNWRVIGPDGTGVGLPVNLFRQFRTLRDDHVRRLFRIHAGAFPQVDEQDLRTVFAWDPFQEGRPARRGWWSASGSGGSMS